ncbi:4-hydroxybenzoyl-CoA reductase [candidate division LCP-89 bacterium B3_LCP]|uniref:4-hydroxybenzoyl-CoA reductase n=1 Tax=candidate division LCP-89 bacterium B3_LCP TaxID=2012998 RepID=A0A532UYJ1_UNCL8|nr:MAG: 4-hydroxybenzoyl-CoA reductase [candidate division LCP-89 bacterium B3_LCP]
MSDYRILNTRAPRVDAFDKVTGKAKYTDDLSMPEMLFGAILHSPQAHARIVKVDTTEAKKLPGVKAVITSEDTEGIAFGVSPARYDEQIFASERVRYVGDEIAAVAAVTPEIARQALDLIKVEFEELPSVLDAHLAMDDEAEQLHERYKNNIVQQVHWDFGDVEAAQKEADVIRTDELTSKMQDAAFLEPQSALATYDQGYLTMYSSTQAPHYIQRTLAMALSLPLHKVRVVKPAVGGGFGPKAACSSMELATCLLAMKTGKPVKITFDREQVFLHSRARHQFFHKMTTGVRKDGTICFLEHEALLDGGAYCSFGIATVYYAGSLLGGPYRLENMKYDGYRVVTNKPACGAQRGHGAVIARACFEIQLDRIAEELNMDPVELRLKNVREAGETTCNELYLSSFGMKEALEAVRDSAAWKNKRDDQPDGKGIGAACGFFVSGAGYPIYYSKTPHCTVVTKLNEVGGGVIVESGAADIGQGSDTMLAMITAEVLGIPLSDVRVMSGDSDLAVDLGAYSSRTTLMTGTAAKEAAESVKAQILEVIADKTGASIDDLDVIDGEVINSKGDLNIEELRHDFRMEHRGFRGIVKSGNLTFNEAARVAFIDKGSIVGTGKYSPPKLGGSFKGAAVGTSPAFGCSAQIAEVDVNLDTGEVTVEKITGAHDCGFAINRTQVEGQMQGSMMMGMGEALMEEIKYDECGRVINANLAEYKIPTSLDMPPLESIIIESHEPNGPFGAKEVGEGGIMPTIPAILNAIYDATGVRINELPVTPERIRTALRKAGKVNK